MEASGHLVSLICQGWDTHSYHCVTQCATLLMELSDNVYDAIISDVNIFVTLAAAILKNRFYYG
jgi:hypothetical protein